MTRFKVIITEYRPLCGGSLYAKTPKCSADKRAVVNVRNDITGEPDNMCFLSAILICLTDEEVPMHKERLSHYRGHERSLNVECITFSVQMKQIPHFENQNPDISLNIITVDLYDGFEEKYSFCIDCESPTETVPCYYWKTRTIRPKTLHVDNKFFAAHVV